MRSLTMEQQVFSYERTGYIRTTVEPSNLIAPAPGIFIQVNDHHELAESPTAAGTQKAVSILTDYFENSLEVADNIINQVMKLAHVSTR